MKLTQINYQEDEITKDYLIGDSCLINNFELKDTRNDEMKSLEFISDNNSSICLYGFLQKHPRNTTNSFFVKILHLKQWNFSESGDIIVQSSRYWYKLLNPSPEYAPTFDLFEQRHNLWRELKPILMSWTSDLSRCEEEDELSMIKNNITIEKVLQKLPNTNEDYLLDHAQFLYDQILQDTSSFSIHGSDVNQMMNTPLLFSLKENRFKKKENQMIKITKETALMDGIELSDSDSYDEKDFGTTSEDESEDTNSEPTQSKSKRRKYKKRETPNKKKKTNHEEKGKRQKKAMKQVYTTAHKMEEGIPSRNYFLEKEFSPQLLSELSVKYEPGICHSGKLIDFTFLNNLNF
ncbi:predicted protein [Naegleria gruberi]|uniref:Predicted protein n=1 Tax=Naegleria gruberi TaxID=5762 RepID=D2UXJ5_NAEGR|nr:uncharacterized protein NAEGRDRAFT_61147 [Naegleria gruberi]EFC50296.1 predicted protein [Naegleria gruberi]|eukprot:XP_002683040.1 predicted protein [Naegleria gruberi strain NEG-M]